MRIAELSVHGCPLGSLGTRDTGGMNVYVREISRELGKRGVTVDVFTRTHNNCEPEIAVLGENVRLIHLEAGQAGDIPKEEIYYHVPELVSNFCSFQEREGLKYDVIHSHYWLSAYMAQRLRPMLGTCRVTTFHTLGAVKNRARPAEQEPELRIATEKETAAASDCLIAFTQEEKNDLVNIYGASPGKVQVIPAGVDTNLFYPADEQTARRKLGLGGGKIILFAGRVEPIKGIDVLLRAVALLGNEEGSRLIIVGGDLEGSDEVLRLRSLACELGIVDRVIFWGAVEQEKMPLFYNAANVCVIPSLHESFCLVALEAMACGTPVVASRVGGLMTTIRDGETGFLVREHSPAAFAGYLALILNNRILEKALGEAGRASVQEYQWSGIAGKVFDAYQQVAQTRCRAD